LSLLSLPAAAGATTVLQAPPFDVGQMVTAAPDTPGDQILWFTCSASDGTLGNALPTNPDGSYTIQDTDVGTDICAQDTATMTSSAPQGPIADLGATPPTISVAASGATVTLTAAAGHWTDPPTNGIQTQWVDCPAATSDPTACMPIPGANGTSYQPQPTDVNSVIEVQQTPMYASGPDAAVLQQSIRQGVVNAPSLTVSGGTTVSSTLTASPVFTGDHIDWEACPGGVASGNSVDTGTTHLVQDTDVGAPLCAVETTEDSPAATLTSAPTGSVIDQGEMVPTFTPPTATEGQTLTAQPGHWTDAPTSFQYQWLRCSAPSTGCSQITGAISSTYLLRPADVTRTIEVTETPVYGSTAVTAAAQTSTQNNIVGSATPSVAGAADTGQTLTAAPVFSDSAVNWFTCPSGNPTGSPLNTAGPSVTYSVRETDFGNQLCAVETTTDTPPVTIKSSATAAVTDPLVDNPPPTFDGQPNDEGTVNATMAQWGQPTSVVTYQWVDCPTATSAPAACTPIAGATGAQYNVQANDVGKSLEVDELPVYGGVVDSNPNVLQQSQRDNTVGGIVPQSQSAPTIAGTATVGDILAETHGNWLAGGETLSAPPAVQWQRGDGSGGFVDIPGATGQTYTLTTADLGLPVRASETDTNVQDPNHTVPSSPAFSNATPAVGESTANTAPPAISGLAQVGQTLSVSPGSWNPSPSSITFSYQWEDCAASACTPISGATGSTYNPSAADLGKALAVEVTAQIFSTSSGPQQSAQTAAVTPAPLNLPAAPANTAPPKISGAAQQGATITASNGTWSGAPTGFNYQWVRCPTAAGSCVPLAGATSAGYVPTANDVDHELAVIVSARNAGGAGPAITSAHTAVIAATTTVQLTIADPHAVSGEPSRLTVVVTSGSSAVTPVGTVTVTRGGKAVHGCSKLPVKGSGQSITVRCTARLDAGKSPLSAVFTPDGGQPLVASPAATHAVSVARAPTTIVLTAPSSATTNARLTYSASVESNTGQAPETGSVVFEDRGHPIAGCERRPIHAGTATCTLSYGLTGRHVITAHFVGAGDFVASTSGPTPERIAEPRAHGAITATLNWTFHFTPRYTNIDALVLHRALEGSTLTMRCTGKGCPFASRTVAIRHSAQTVNLEHGFQGRRLGVRATLVITITRPSYIGKYYRFAIRARQEPKILISCLALGSDRPGVGCTRP
jgi:hypothetical protein